MKNHDGCERGFIWSAKAYYSEVVGCKNEIMFGMYDEGGDGGTTGEMAMKWIDICNEEVPQLQCFDDGWSALSLFPDLIEKMGKHDDESLTQEQFVEILKSCGFKDFTKYDNPYQ